MPRTNAFLAVGSNIEPERNLPRALDMLLAGDELSVIATSTVYRTAPVGHPDQPAFANGVWQIAADPGPRELKFELLREIETALGRVRTEDKYAPRPIDLDLILYGEKAIDSDGLTLPDPDIRRRAFISVPLMELAPGLRLPDTGETIESVAAGAAGGTMEIWTELTDHLRRLLQR